MPGAQNGGGFVPSLTERDWRELFLWSRRQSVVAVVWDGMHRMMGSRSAEIPRKVYWAWCAQVVQIERENERHEACLSELCGVLRPTNAPLLLLKGLGAGRLYPNARHRQSGDIDLYAGAGRRFVAAASLLQSRADGVLQGEDEKHAIYSCRGVGVELHRVAIRFQSPLLHRRFHKHLQTVFPDGLREIVIGRSARVRILPPEVNVFYQLAHIFHHLLEGGVGLRQLCDWTLSVWHWNGQMNHSAFLTLVRRFSYERVYGAVAALSVGYLGLPEESLPIPLQSGDAHRASILLERILDGGNFGRFRTAKAGAGRRGLYGDWLRFRHTCAETRLWADFCPQEAWWKPVQKLRFYAVRKINSRIRKMKKLLYGLLNASNRML